MAQWPVMNISLGISSPGAKSSSYLPKKGGNGVLAASFYDGHPEVGKLQLLVFPPPLIDTSVNVKSEQLSLPHRT